MTRALDPKSGSMKAVLNDPTHWYAETWMTVALVFRLTGRVKAKGVMGMVNWQSGAKTRCGGRF